LKKLTAIAAILAVSIVAYAGPYFIIEQNPIDLDASMVVGWDFDAPFINFTNLGVYGDFNVENDNVWVYPTPWILGGELGLAWFSEALALDCFEIGVATDLILAPAAWPEYVELDSWTTSFEIIGRPSRVVTLYANADFVFEVTNPPGPVGFTGLWTFLPRVGIEGHW